MTDYGRIDENLEGFGDADAEVDGDGHRLDEAEGEGDGDGEVDEHMLDVCEVVAREIGGGGDDDEFPPVD